MDNITQNSELANSTSFLFSENRETTKNNLDKFHPDLSSVKPLFPQKGEFNQQKAIELVNSESFLEIKRNLFGDGSHISENALKASNIVTSREKTQAQADRNARCGVVLNSEQDTNSHNGYKNNNYSCHHDRLCPLCMANRVKSNGHELMNHGPSNFLVKIFETKEEANNHQRRAKYNGADKTFWAQSSILYNDGEKSWVSVVDHSADGDEIPLLEWMGIDEDHITYFSDDSIKEKYADGCYILFSNEEDTRLNKSQSYGETVEEEEREGFTYNTPILQTPLTEKKNVEYIQDFIHSEIPFNREDKESMQASVDARDDLFREILDAAGIHYEILGYKKKVFVDLVVMSKSTKDITSKSTKGMSVGEILKLYGINKPKEMLEPIETS